MKNTFNLFALRLALVVALLCAFSGAMGAPSSGPTPIDAPQNEHSIVVISDICGNKYNVVKIGKQLWMAENMRCNKYDTESERAGATVPLPRVTNAYYPYYQVYPSSGTNQAGFNGKLLSSQIPYLGIFFSWAAAVGFANDTEALSQTTPFKNHRQGICPNGWHLPTIDEWHELVDFIELTDGKGKYTAGKHLKTKEGWHNNKNGLDTYGFSALPADRANMSGTYGVGGWGKWWTSDAISNYNGSAVQVYHGGDDFMFSANEIQDKRHALCVRCIKNPEKLEIKFVNYDGTELQSGEVEYGQTPSYTGATPEKPADAEFTYTFSGWSPEVVMVTETATYTAQFSNTVNKYVIRFLDENGAVLQSSEVAYGSTPAYTGENPTKQATAQYTYTFNGWDSEITEVTGAKDYTATYNSITNKYLITFENYNGEELQSSEVEYGQTPSYTGATPEKPADAEFTYTFSGWSPEVVMVTDAATYTAQFSNTVNKYIIRFLDENGAVLQSSEVAYGSTPAYTGENPTKQATAQYTYTFNGWDSEITEVTGAKDYTATYNSITNKYLITFENYNGEELQSSEVEYGQTPSYTGATPEKPADAEFTYTFSGWSPEVVMVTETATYTAQFSNTVNKYVIRFLDENGDVLQSSEVAYGSTPAYTGETPIKQATAQYTYTFNGWDSEITKVTGAKDYTATYTAILVHQTADNTPECANAPAVAKYDWLLMLQANAIKDMGYNLNENIVEWYKVVGEMDNLDSGERDDEKVGTGYYYTINSSLNSTGDYYALIDLPWQTSEVGCNGLMRTVVFHYTPKGSTKRAMAVSPTIAFPQQEIEVRDLPQEVAEVYVYDVAGRLCRSFRTNGEATTMFNAEQNAGTYIVVVWTSKGKETFKYIVRMR